VKVLIPRQKEVQLKAMKVRIVMVAFLTALIGVILYFFMFAHQWQADRALNSGQAPPPRPLAKFSPLPDTPASKPPGSEASQAQTAAPAATTSDLQFQSWLAKEARQLDSPSVDSAVKQREMRRIARNLTPAQSRHLGETALAESAPVGTRILSAYLLVEGGLNTQDELRRVIQAPLKNQGPAPAHSENELKGAQEKSLRIMAIDGLASRAKTDPRARQALEQAAHESADAYIRQYAERRLLRL
jgi:hypothetical protein